jgi:hypothetical protein
MATGMAPHQAPAAITLAPVEPGRRTIYAAVAITLVFVVATRWPVARAGPMEPDELGFLAQIAGHWFPMHHTLFMTLGRLFGLAAGDAYRGFIVLDMLTSAAALVSVWWMLRAMVRPATAAAAALVLGVGPVFWGYGAMAGNYPVIVAVGAFLLGIAYRGRSRAEGWHAYAAAAVFALGAGYRQDIGTFWLVVYGVILWQHRWKRAVLSCALFTILNLLWLGAMLHENGGWARYRATSAAFAYQCGYLNSVWHLGVVDSVVRYSVKLAMALVWTLGPALLLVPRGGARLRQIEGGWFLGSLMAAAAIPALGSHLLVTFGVAGWCFHYIPTLIALAALGAGGARVAPTNPARFAPGFAGLFSDTSVRRLSYIAALLAAAFWFYPTDYRRGGLRGSFDLAFCRFTRAGLRTPMPDEGPQYWRTANSRLAGPAPVHTPTRELDNPG